MSSETQIDKCTYIAHDNGIHEFVLADGSNETLDQWLYHIDQIFAQHLQEQLLRVLYVSQRDLLPSIPSMMARVRMLYKRHPVRPPVRQVIIYDNPRMVSILNVFVQVSNITGRVDATRFFSKAQRQEALEWLLLDS
jgi:uncharacterized protein YukJ